MSLPRLVLPRDDARRAAQLAVGLTLGLMIVCAADSSPSPRIAPRSRPARLPALTPPGLWLASTAAPSVLRLDQSQLDQGGHVLPARVVTTTALPIHSVVGVAFDTGGRMWVADQGDSVLLAFSPATLGDSGGRRIESVITATKHSLSAPVGIAFDARHGLWVANFGNGTLTRFDRAQLATSGAPAPAVVIGGLDRPTALAFDTAGSLWVSDMRAQTIVAYGADQLATSGSPKPRVRIRGGRRSLAAPTGLAFARDGSLWVSNLGNGTVVGFDATQLTESGSPTPSVTIGAERAGLIGAPAGLAFDDDGSLWIAGLEGTVTRVQREQLAMGVTPTPSTSLTLDGHALLWGAAFWPTPKGLPLN